MFIPIWQILEKKVTVLRKWLYFRTILRRKISRHAADTGNSSDFLLCWECVSRKNIPFYMRSISHWLNFSSFKNCKFSFQKTQNFISKKAFLRHIIILSTFYINSAAFFLFSEMFFFLKKTIFFSHKNPFLFSFSSAFYGNFALVGSFVFSFYELNVKSHVIAKLIFKKRTHGGMIFYLLPYLIMVEIYWTTRGYLWRITWT